MWGRKTKTQTYDQALEVVAAGGASLADTYTVHATDLKNKADLDHRLYTIFAEEAPKHMQAFICGPFGNWDGTSQGVFYDGMVFGTERQSFIDALQHHRSEDGACYIWDFLLGFRSIHVFSPLYEKVSFDYIQWEDGTEIRYPTRAEAEKVWKSGKLEGRRAMGSSYHISRRQ